MSPFGSSISVLTMNWMMADMAPIRLQKGPLGYSMVPIRECSVDSIGPDELPQTIDEASRGPSWSVRKFCPNATLKHYGLEDPERVLERATSTAKFMLESIYENAAHRVQCLNAYTERVMAKMESSSSSSSSDGTDSGDEATQVVGCARPPLSPLPPVFLSVF